MNLKKYFNLTKKHLFIYFFFVYTGTSIIGEILRLPFVIELLIWFILMEIGDLFYRKVQKDKTNI